MALPIYLYGQPVLRKVAEEIDKEYPKLKELVASMFDTMYESEGVGLAAPQIGLSIRLLVIDTTVLADDFPECEGFKRVMINANIIECNNEEVSLEEGCLSLPGIHEKVSRPTLIRVRYMDENFVKHEEIVQGFNARAVQHEYDHLEGKLFIDYISTIRKQLIKSKLNSIIKGNMRCSYRTKVVGK